MQAEYYLLRLRHGRISRAEPLRQDTDGGIDPAVRGPSMNVPGFLHQAAIPMDPGFHAMTETDRPGNRAGQVPSRTPPASSMR